MSRIILSRYEDGEHHWVVGWDHPANGTFWQEWATKEEILHAERWLEEHENDYHIDVETSNHYMQIAQTGVKDEDGMWPGIPLGLLYEKSPEDLQALLRERRVLDTLQAHAKDPESGRIILDLSH